MPVAMDDLEHAYRCASVDGGNTNRAFVDRETGSVFVAGGDAEDEEEQAEKPDDLETNPRYLRAPDKWSLGLGTPLVMAFTRERLPQEAESVARLFAHQHDAIDAFKALLAERGLEADWYAFESEAEDKVLRGWAAANGLPIED